MPPTRAVWALLGEIGRLVLDEDGYFGMCFAHRERTNSGRQRGIFPLPLPLWKDCAGLGSADAYSSQDALNYCQGAVVVLNYGYGCPTYRARTPVTSNATQKAALVGFGQQAFELVEHLAADVPVGMSESDAWDAFQGRAT